MGLNESPLGGSAGGANPLTNMVNVNINKTPIVIRGNTTSDQCQYFRVEVSFQMQY